MTGTYHERFDREEEVKRSSDRSFGFVFAAFFLIVALFPLLNNGSVRLWSLIASCVFLVWALVAPRYLAPLNRLWARFGDLLHRVMNPLILGLIFYVAIMPVSLVLRIIGKDSLHRRADPNAVSYWIDRNPRGPAPQTMRDQF